MQENIETTPRELHWLVAAWPGAAGVAATAAAYLINTLALRPAGELAPRGHFDIQAVRVKNGLIGKPRLPKNVLFTGRLPGNFGKLTVFIGEAQPAAGAYGFAHELLDRAKGMGVDRLVTFASISAQLLPTQNPAIFAAGTDQHVIDEARKFDVQTLEEAHIGGLNGVLLGAAMHRGIPGLCLLSEIPYFAPHIQNPKSVKYVLEAFSRLSGATIDTRSLDADAKKVDRILTDLMNNMQSAAGEHPLPETEPEFSIGEATDEEIARSAADEPVTDQVSPEINEAVENRIERLFDAAREDRSRSAKLKEALDAHGVFGQYEDRFLDLFKQKN